MMRDCAVDTPARRSVTFIPTLLNIASEELALKFGSACVLAGMVNCSGPCVRGWTAMARAGRPNRTVTRLPRRTVVPASGTSSRATPVPTNTGEIPRRAHCSETSRTVIPPAGEPSRPLRQQVQASERVCSRFRVAMTWTQYRLARWPIQIARDRSHWSRFPWRHSGLIAGALKPRSYRLVLRHIQVSEHLFGHALENWSGDVTAFMQADG